MAIWPLGGVSDRDDDRVERERVVAVTACGAVSAPVAINSDEPSVSAQCVAVAVFVTVPSVIAGTVTLRPSTAPSAGAPVFKPVLLPSE